MSIWKDLFGPSKTQEEKERDYWLHEYVPTSNEPTQFYTCPVCGYAIRSISNNGIKCKNCQKLIIIRDGKVKGWR